MPYWWRDGLVALYGSVHLRSNLAGLFRERKTGNRSHVHERLGRRKGLAEGKVWWKGRHGGREGWVEVKAWRKESLVEWNVWRKERLEGREGLAQGNAWWKERLGGREGLAAGRGCIDGPGLNGGRVTSLPIFLEGK